METQAHQSDPTGFPAQSSFNPKEDVLVTLRLTPGMGLGCVFNSLDWIWVDLQPDPSHPTHLRLGIDDQCEVCK